MRVRAAHDLAAVLEDLHRADVGAPAEIDRLLDPGVDHPLDVADLHLGDRQVVAGREAQDPADAGFALGDEEAVLDPLSRSVAAQRGEIVVEHEGVRVVGVLSAVRSHIAGAEVAGRVVGGQPGRGNRLAPALPRALHAMRRNQHPFAGQRVEPAMRGVRELEDHAGGLSYDAVTRPGRAPSDPSWRHAPLPQLAGEGGAKRMGCDLLQRS